MRVTKSHTGKAGRILDLLGVRGHVTAFEQQSADLGVVCHQLHGSADDLVFHLVEVHPALVFEDRAAEPGAVLHAGHNDWRVLAYTHRRQHPLVETALIRAKDAKLLVRLQRTEHHRNLTQAGQEYWDRQCLGELALEAGEVSTRAHDRAAAIPDELSCGGKYGFKQSRVATDESGTVGTLDDLEPDRVVERRRVRDVARENRGIRCSAARSR